MARMTFYVLMCC